MVRLHRGPGCPGGPFGPFGDVPGGAGFCAIGPVVEGIAFNPKSKDLMNNCAFSFIVGWPEMW